VLIASCLLVPVHVLDDKMFHEYNYDDDEPDFVPIWASSGREEIEIIFIRIK
jgi:hypothetical protein